MNKHTLSLLVGAGLGVGIADPFSPVRWCAARQHPRRDPEGHPNGGGGNGGDGGGAAGGTGTGGGEPNGGGQKNEPGKSGGGSAPDPAQDWAKLFEGLTPAQVKEKLDNSRKWEDRSKENFPKAQKYDELVQALTGDGGGDQEPDPAKLASDLSASQKVTRETKVENAVLRTAGAHGPALVDSRSFMAKVKDFDPAAADFEQQIKAAIDTHQKDNPDAGGYGAQIDPYLRHPGSLKTSTRELGSSEADRRFGPKT